MNTPLPKTQSFTWFLPVCCLVLKAGSLDQLEGCCPSQEHGSEDHVWKHIWPQQAWFWGAAWGRWIRWPPCSSAETASWSLWREKATKRDFCLSALKTREPTVTRTNSCSAPSTRTTGFGPAASLTILSSAERWVIAVQLQGWCTSATYYSLIW